MHELGDLDGARQMYQEVAQRWSLSYYAYQARNRMIEMAEQEVHQRLVQSLRDGGDALSSQPAPQDALLTPEDAPVCAWTEVAAQPSAVAPVPQRAARIHWSGPGDRPSPSAGAGFGQVPTSGQDDERMMPYITQRPLRGAARRAAQLHGDLWPHLRAVSFLFDLGMESAARTELREVTLEFRGLDLARARPRANRPLPLPYKKWAHYIDHRGAKRRGFWGLPTSSSRYPVPRSLAGKRALYERQSAILGRASTLRGDLRQAMMEVGDFHFVRKMRLGDGAWWRHDPANEQHRAMWSEAYPRAFPEYVQRYAAREGLNPYLLWALMTVESAYNPDSVSYADARGLLQVIPKTGGKVAADIGDNRYGPYDLLDPETSIRHGAWYFARLVKKFKGQEPLAIASYNGGPHNIQRWLRHKDHVPLDEFVEEIPFDQARRYTKKVLRFLALFLRLYEDTDELYVGQALSSDVLVDPRY
jgi:soluble lytic murein transglycosylase